VIAEAADGRQLVEMTERLNPDVVVTDIKMPGIDGIQATKMLTEKFPAVNVIALSMFDDENLIVDMLEAGARGYLLKNAHKTEIIEAIKAVHHHEIYYCNHTTRKLAALIAKSKFTPNQPKPQFTDKEIEIIQLICQEYSNKEIATQLHIGPRTIESYRERIMEKMNVRNTAGIVVYAIRKNIYKI
jgi:DNA-binding NarL/FixJ family response regulator